MKKRKTVYCEMAFLLNFLKNRPNDDDFEDYREDSWKGLGRFLKRSDLIVDVTQEEFVRDCEKDANNADENRISAFLKSIIKKSSQGEITLSFKDKFISINSIDGKEQELNSVFLTNSEDSVCQEKSSGYGVITLNTAGVFSSNHLYKDNGIAFPNENNDKWDFLNKLNRDSPQLKYCNSMLIVDNFVFSDSKDSITKVISVSFQDKIDYNLKPIFKALLPDKLADGLEFEISIFTGDRKNNENFEKSYKYICLLLSQIRPNLKFRLTLYNKAFSKFHDRTIVTNNVWISCQAGFDVFGKNGRIRNTTNTSVIFPYFTNDINWADNAFRNVLKSAKCIIERYPEPNRNFWGSAEHKNRIVSYYTSYEITETRRNQQAQNRNYPVSDRFSRTYGWG